MSKEFILKRLKDGNYVQVGEKELKSTLSRCDFDGSKFIPQFELIGEQEDIISELEKLFETK